MRSPHLWSNHSAFQSNHWFKDNTAVDTIAPVVARFVQSQKTIPLNSIRVLFTFDRTVFSSGEMWSINVKVFVTSTVNYNEMVKLMSW